MKRPHRIDRTKSIVVNTALGGVVAALLLATWYAADFAMRAPELARQVGFSSDEASSVGDAVGDGGKLASPHNAPALVGMEPTAETTSAEPPLPPERRTAATRDRRAVAAARAALKRHSVFRARQTPSVRAPASLALAPVFSRPIEATRRAPYQRLTSPPTLRRPSLTAHHRRPVLSTWIDRRRAGPKPGVVIVRPAPPVVDLDAATVAAAARDAVFRRVEGPAHAPTVANLASASTPAAETVFSADRLAPDRPLAPLARTLTLDVVASSGPMRPYETREGPDVLAGAANETAKRLQPQQTPARAVTTAGAEAARIVIQYAGRSQRPAADSAAAALRAQGFERIQFVEVPVGVRRTEVRYFHDTDAAAVDLVRSAMTSLGDDARVRDFTYYDPPPSFGTIELWLPRRRR